MKSVVVAVQACQGIVEGAVTEVHHFRTEGECKGHHPMDMIKALFTGQEPKHEPGQKGGATMIVSTDYKGQMINVGYSVCVSTDNFDRKDGRNRAMTRLTDKDPAYTFAISIDTLMKMAKSEMAQHGLFDYLAKPVIDRLEYQNLSRDAVKGILKNMMQEHHQHFHFGPNSVKNQKRQAEKAAAKVAKEVAKNDGGSPESGTSNS